MTEQELYDGLKRICEAQEATMRQCRIMVAGFKATGEQDRCMRSTFSSSARASKANVRHSALHHASRLLPTYHEMMTFPDYAKFSEYERLVPRMKKEFGVKVFYLDTEKDELIEV